MIITCPNCNKKFQIDVKLVPEKGRLLQCSSCNHKWHYIIPKKENEIDKSKNIQNKNNLSISKISQEQNNDKLKKKTTNKIYEKIKSKNQELIINKKNSNKKYTLGTLLAHLMIMFVSFIALILIIDTFKINISNYFPILIPLLDNLYQSLIDLISFIKDLLN